MLINGRFLTRPATGVDRFAIELLRASAAVSPGMPWHAAVPGTTHPDLPWPGDVHTHPTGRLNGHAWEQFELPRFAKDQPLVNLCNTGPVMRERQLVVLHDAGAVANPGNYSRAFRAWYRPMMGALMRRSRVVATVSKFSADELMRHFGRSQHRKLEVFVEGGEHIQRCAPDEGVIDRNGLRGRRFVLAVGSRSANKNFAAVVRAVNALQDPDVLLVAAGGGNSRVFTSTDVQDERLRYTGYVSDGELRALYQHAMCFAFPSFYEGFGLPPLEAMCCGCPVIVSDRASLPEVCGDAALYCNPDDPSTLTQQLQRLIESPALRAELREAGFAQAAVFGWDKAARQFAQLMGDRFPENDEARRFSTRVRESAQPPMNLSPACG